MDLENEWEEYIEEDDNIGEFDGIIKNTPYIITSDTDSLFVHVKDLLLHRYPDIDLTDREYVSKRILEIAAEIQSAANKNLDKLVIDLFNLKPEDQHYFELKQEVIAERGYFAGKRRYSLFVINKEGNPKSEKSTMGLDLMKSDFPPLFSEFGEGLLDKILAGASKEDIDKELLDFKDLVRSIHWTKLLKPTGVKNIKKYFSHKSEEDVFSSLLPKCPKNTKAAIYYNDFLEYFKLNEYQKIQLGDKMQVAYLKSNPWGINCIGYKTYNDPPIIDELISDYIDRDGLFENIMKNKIINLYTDIGWDIPNFNRKQKKFFI